MLGLLLAESGEGANQQKNRNNQGVSEFHDNSFFKVANFSRSWQL
jgi:hypothetical protein